MKLGRRNLNHYSKFSPARRVLPFRPSTHIRVFAYEPRRLSLSNQANIDRGRARREHNQTGGWLTVRKMKGNLLGLGLHSVQSRTPPPPATVPPRQLRLYHASGHHHSPTPRSVSLSICPRLNPVTFNVHASSELPSLMSSSFQRPGRRGGHV